jgi:hypothetical protein
MPLCPKAAHQSFIYLSPLHDTKQQDGPETACAGVDLGVTLFVTLQGPTVTTQTTTRNRSVTAGFSNESHW